jgi:hypothetical protein
MASFANETPALRFPLPRLPRSSWEAANWLLWPVLAWRVVAPRPRPRRLNLFERAILGLRRSGETHAESIAERLLIDRDLAAHISLELQGMDCLDARGMLTERGQRMLKEDESEAIEQTVGWIFTDPFSGDVWPRFHAGELPYAETELNERGRPVLLSGSVGNPRRNRAFAVLPWPNEPIRESQPRAEDVLRAVRAHRRQHAWEEEPEVADAPSLQRVSFVSDDPTAHLLALRAWPDEARDWHVDDPFGLGESAKLRRWLEARFTTQPALRDWVVPPPDGDLVSADLKSLAVRAAWDVEARIPLANKEGLFERLVAMQRALLETGLPDCPDDKWDDVTVKAQRAVERMLHDLRESHPPRAMLAQDVALNELLLNDLAKTAGFHTPLPPSLARVRHGKVQNAAQYGGGSLRPLLVLALLSTAGLDQHPLRRAAAEAPDLLHRLDAVATVRDSSAHEGSGERTSQREQEQRRQRIREAVETVFTSVALLQTN